MVFQLKFSRVTVVLLLISACQFGHHQKSKTSKVPLDKVVLLKTWVLQHLPYLIFGASMKEQAEAYLQPFSLVRLEGQGAAADSNRNPDSNIGVASALFGNRLSNNAAYHAAGSQGLSSY